VFIFYKRTTTLVFAAQRYASAVYAMALCPSVRQSVWHLLLGDRQQCWKWVGMELYIQFIRIRFANVYYFSVTHSMMQTISLYSQQIEYNRRIRQIRDQHESNVQNDLTEQLN